MRPLAAAAALAVLALALPAPSRAEVAAGQRGSNVDTLLIKPLGITDGVDPIPQWWEPYRPLPPGFQLNTSGVLRLDGRPDVTWRPADGWPFVVWAYENQSDHDIALAHWKDGAWSAIEFLTAGASDEVDPRLFVEPDGTLHVVWCVADAAASEKIQWLERPAQSDAWNAPVAAVPAGESGERPTVAVADGAVLVAYEREPPGASTREVVVRRQVNDGSFVEELVVLTGRAEALDPVLHVSGGKVWLDWKHGAAELGFAERTPAGWSAIGAHPWLDASWVGEEMARHAIHGLVREGNGQPAAGP
jgi:hypothetical protein